MFAVADTSYVLTVAIATDINHKICLAIHKEQGIVYLPQTTLAEIAYFLTREFGNEVVSRFLVQMPQTKYRLIPLEPEDILRTANLLQHYNDSRLDFVDATIVAVAERLKITRILTLDRRDFEMVRPNHSEYFEILPSP
jgi:predicted nucleic acid-binding protein